MSTRLPYWWSIAIALFGAVPSAGAQLRLPSAGSEASRLAAPAAGSGTSAAPQSPGDPGRRATPVPVDRVVAIVNREAITEQELAQRTRTISQRARSQGMAMPAPEVLQRQVLERMIFDRAAMQAARDVGIRIDDAQVDRAIARIAQDARMSVPQLRERLESEGVSMASFRQEIASEIAVTRLREREVDARIQVSEAEIDAFMAEQAAAPAAPVEFDIAQILVRVPEGASAEQLEAARQRAEAIAREARAGVDFARLAASVATGGDDATATALGMRPADRLPPLFVKAVESLRPGQVAEVVRSDAGFHVLKLLDRLGGVVSALAGAPVAQTRARHILIRVNEINPEAEVVRRLTEIRQRIEAGAVRFEDMARQYSVDGSAQQGGDLGWVYPGDTVPEFERAMDALQPGQLTGPVRTPFGYHLIEVVERRTDEASPERARAAVRNTLRERKAAEAYQEWMAQIRDRAYVDVRLDER
jgi:peptidyl-prolyl cis-trans isomerase SurA